MLYLQSPCYCHRVATGMAFAYCKSLKDITLPQSLTTIGTGAFYTCTSLTDLDIPQSVTEIKEEAFNGCSELERIEYDGTKTDWQNMKIVCDSPQENIFVVGDSEMLGKFFKTESPKNMVVIGNNGEKWNVGGNRWFLEGKWSV